MKNEQEPGWDALIGRVHELLDAGTFREVGTFTGLGIESPRDAFVAGVNVAIVANQPPVRGGALGRLRP